VTHGDPREVRQLALLDVAERTVFLDVPANQFVDVGNGPDREYPFEKIICFFGGV
jgi:hypothetical protein